MANLEDDGAAVSARVAVYGGSFDPPHIAHVMVATWALCSGEVDEVRVVPTYSHAFDKGTRTGFDARLRLCELAMRPLRGVIVDDIERDLGGTSRTFETLTLLSERMPGATFRLVIGADILISTDRWYRWPDIEKMAPPLVIGRDGYPAPPGTSISMPNVSSTEIRAQLRSGTAATELHTLPAAVAQEIERAGLYAPTASRDGADA